MKRFGGLARRATQVRQAVLARRSTGKGRRGIFVGAALIGVVLLAGLWTIGSAAGNALGFGANRGNNAALPAPTVPAPPQADGTAPEAIDNTAPQAGNAAPQDAPQPPQPQADERGPKPERGPAEAGPKGPRGGHPHDAPAPPQSLTAPQPLAAPAGVGWWNTITTPLSMLATPFTWLAGPLHVLNMAASLLFGTLCIGAGVSLLRGRRSPSEPPLD